MDGMTFFQKSAGQWKSQRTTHHLPFRRAETGDSEIYVEASSADNPKIIAICEMHEVDPAKTVGGAFVSWDGSMQWDKENENHQGTTVFALIPDEDNPQAGVLLRERGYAEIIPVAGRYHIDEQEGLVLITEYETMTSIERFWFADADLRLRTSTVQRFGGFNTATFCAESRNQSSESVSSDSPEPSSYSISGW
ncbi:phycobiliprotein lyase [Microcystis aeruginosa EAWAG127a]|uniref:Chromophore lyase CpcS/CpeS n=1 Tax=Microcystis aeruginosa EAWAG127a TaxID=2529855 RepID=A0A5J5LS32_MICAE|nr:phycobiliprotein lyase [Microcystis aeruginosa]KAB0240320.1 phycobiliprotein lyase [Microcystis aeruginosa EAWAG127a]